MSGKLSEVESRIGTVHQFEAVITAMRGSAAARSREARNRLDGIHAYAAAIGAAIGQALALAQEPDPPPRKRAHARKGRPRAVRRTGFCRHVDERVLDAAESRLEYWVQSSSSSATRRDGRSRTGVSVRLVGGDGGPRQEVPLLASRITDALYARLEKGQATRVTVIHAAPSPSATIEVVERALLPFDFARFKVAPRRIPPITTFPRSSSLPSSPRSTSTPSCARR